MSHESAPDVRYVLPGDWRVLESIDEDGALQSLGRVNGPREALRLFWLGADPSAFSESDLASVGAARGLVNPIRIEHPEKFLTLRFRTQLNLHGTREDVYLLAHPTRGDVVAVEVSAPEKAYDEADFDAIAQGVSWDVVA